LKTDDPDDWTWWHPTVPGRIQQAFDEGFQIVIITSQGRLTLRDGSASSAQALFKTKIESILQALSVPVTLYAACANDNWRKPRTRTWQHFLQRLSQEGEVDEGKSFLVGDAAGRVGDHDAADRHFCENVGIEFFTPEEWFLGAKKEEYIDRFDPKRYLGPNNRPEGISKTLTALHVKPAKRFA
jgi:bifunctional polynucleotide phosphatase/kinase